MHRSFRSRCAYRRPARRENAMCTQNKDGHQYTDSRQATEKN